MPQLQELYGNFGIGFLVSAIGAGDTALQVSPVNPACSFPALTSGAGQFHITVSNIDSNGFPTNPEIMLVTANNAGAVTVVRAQEQTSAVSHAANERVEFGISAAVLRAIAPSGVAMTGSGAQTWNPAYKRLNFTATGASNITIDPASMVPWNDYTLKDAGMNAATNNITLTPLTGTINDDAADASRTLVYNGQAITVFSDGTNLWVKS